MPELDPYRQNRIFEHEDCVAKLVMQRHSCVEHCYAGSPRPASCSAVGKDEVCRPNSFAADDQEPGDTTWHILVRDDQEITPTSARE